MKLLKSVGLLVGRLCISLIFILAGIGKVMDWSGTSQYMASQGMTFIPLFLLLAIIIELVFGIGIFIGYYTRISALILLAYLVPVTGIMHSFWNAPEGMHQLQMLMFLKNIAIFGGLIYVAVIGAGGFSIDKIVNKHLRDHE